MRIVDLFSGAGGLTFGFYYNLINGQFVRNENNHFIFANEFNQYAAQAFRRNFNDIHLIEGDIHNVTEQDIQQLIGDQEVDIVIGGPPCQSFSTVGKRVYDDKAKMYNEYLNKLSIIRPKMFLFENVKGILSMKETFYQVDEEGKIVYKEEKHERNGKKIIKKKPIITGYGDKIMKIICDKFSHIDDNLGYEIKHKVLNAKDYGVPQSRERVFIIGIRKDCEIEWDFPDATYGENLNDYITLEEAISDMPQADFNNETKMYATTPQNNYQQLMRGKNQEIDNHFVARHGEKLNLIIPKVPCGEGKNYINKLVDDGELPELCRLTSGYNNTYGRLVGNIPCTTITNNMTTPSALRCIHYRENRTISPREGARIQSFPDWFNFYGGLTQVTTQIGNAVPPLLAIAMARKIEEVLGE